MVSQQKKLLDLFKEIDAICRRHGIEYYLAGGTCIGAIRHRGFLPWDDDMDLYMTRDNWEKFIKVCRQDLPENRVLLCPELDSTYSNLFGRYCDTDTTLLHRHNIYTKHNEDDPCGYIVDILPLDPIPYSEEFLKKYTQKICILSDIINCIGKYSIRWQVKPSMYLRYVWRSLWNKEKVVKELFDELFRYEEKDCDYFAMRWGGTPLLFPKEWFQKPTECLFEDTLAMMPTMSNAYLTMHYGDSWSEVPHVSERSSHVAVHRTDIPYDQFREEYEPFVGHSKIHYVRFASIVYKTIHLFLAPKIDARRMRKRALKGARMVETFGLEKQETLDMLAQMLEEYQISEAGNYLARIAKLQASAEYIGREDFQNVRAYNLPTLIEMSDRLFELLMRYMVFSGKIWAALRIIGIREKRMSLTEPVKTLREDMLTFRDAVNDYALGNLVAAVSKAEALAVRYSAWDALLKLRIRLTVYKGQGTSAQCRELLDVADRLYPNDGEFVRYRLELDRLEGKPFRLEEDLCINCSIMENTNNGMVHMDIRDEMAEHISEYEEHIAAITAAGHWEEAARWVEMCIKTCPESMHEKLTLMKIVIDFRRKEKELSEKGESCYPQRARFLRKLRKGLSASSEMAEGWAEEYFCQLMESGYGEEAAHIWVRLATLDGEYEALQELLANLSSEDTTDLLLARAECLHMLGYSQEESNCRQKAASTAEEGSFLQYQAWSRAENSKVVSKASVPKIPKPVATKNFSRKPTWHYFKKTIVWVFWKLYPIRRDWRRIHCVNARDKLREHYSKKIPLLRELLKNDDVIRLKKELKLYDEKLWKFLKECKMTIVFDREIFEMYLAVYYPNGGPAAKHLISKIPRIWRKEAGL